MAEGLRIVFKGEQVGPKLSRGLTAAHARVVAALRITAYQMAAAIEQRGRADMASAGNFSSARWQEGFTATVTENGGLTITIAHAVPYWTVFEFGATIQGRPLLWIPLSHTGVKVRASEYPGSLFRVDRTRQSGGGFKGQKRGAGGQFSGGFQAPLLLDASTKEPIYFGKESVTIPKKFHLEDIIKDVASHAREIYAENFRATG